MNKSKLPTENLRSKNLRISIPLLLAFLFIALFSIFKPYMYNLFHEKKLSDSLFNPIILGLDFKGGARVVYELEEDQFTNTTKSKELLERSKKILIERLSEYGNYEPNIKINENDKQIIVELPGVTDYEQISDLVGQTGKLELYFLKDKIINDKDIPLKAPDSIYDELLMTKEDLKDVKVKNIPNIHVALDLNENSKELIHKKLIKHAGGKIAILISGVVVDIIGVSNAFSNNIYDDKGKIVGQKPTEDYSSLDLIISNDLGMSLSQAKMTEKILKWDVLPANLKIINRTRIGSVLSKDQFLYSVSSLLLGIILIMLFFLIFYGIYLGTVGIIIFIYSAILIYGFFSTSGLVLSLPGMAGLILTVGVSVDSSILIFESIKEEIRKRQDLDIEELDEGIIWNSIGKITNQLWTLRMTTIVGSIVLFFFSGPMKGFAVTMIVGLLVSIIVSTRPFIGGILLLFENTGKNVNKLNYGIPVFEGEKFKRFLSSLLKKKKAISLFSFSFAGLAIFLSYFIGFNISDDFKTATQLQISYNKNINKKEIENSIRSLNKFTDSKLISLQEVEIKDRVAYLIKFNPLNDDQLNEISDFLSTKDSSFSIDAEYTTASTISNDTLFNWILAIILSLFLVFLYCLIFGRVKVTNSSIWPSFLAILATFHDVFVVLGIVCIFRIEMSIAVFTSILLLIGYSINDSLVLIYRIKSTKQKFDEEENEQRKKCEYLFNNFLNYILIKKYDDYHQTNYITKLHLSDLDILSKLIDEVRKEIQLILNCTDDECFNNKLDVFENLFKKIQNHVINLEERNSLQGYYHSIKENLNDFKNFRDKRNYSQIVNSSVLEIRSRTINTNLTTIIGIIPILFLGTNFIRPFIITTIIGLIVGTFSSTFVVGTFLENDFLKKTKAYKINKI